MALRELTFRKLSRSALCVLQRRALDAVRRDAILTTESSYSLTQRQAWLHALQSADHTAEASDIVMVAEHNAAIAYAEIDLADGHMSGLFVTPMCHRTGIGTSLFETAQHLTTQAGHTTLSLSATPDAAPFYEQRGCQRVSELTLLLGDELLPCLFYEKSLRFTGLY